MRLVMGNEESRDLTRMDWHRRIAEEAEFVYAPASDPVGAPVSGVIVLGCNKGQARLRVRLIVDGLEEGYVQVLRRPA
ncbi:hypothetical protein ES703_98832 [subsurface metagenome]